jgi:predicted NBD/HSP70 family sugar kinase
MSEIMTVDAGGSRKGRVGIVSNGKVIAGPHFIPFDSGLSFTDMVKAAVEHQNCEGIAIAVPGPVWDNILLKAPNLPELVGVPLATLVEDATDLPVRLFNDMSAAAAGMARLCPKVPDFLALTLSSGVGARIVHGGKIVSSNVEFGHVCLDFGPDAPFCGCGATGCVEAFIGGEAGKARIPRSIVGTAEILQYLTHDHVWGLEEPGANVWEVLDAGFAANEEWAVNYYTEFATRFGQALSIWRCCCEFGTVIFKGTTALMMPPIIWDWAKDQMERCMQINQGWAEVMKFVRSPDPTNDALIGAAELFIQNL